MECLRRPQRNFSATKDILIGITPDAMREVYRIEGYDRVENVEKITMLLLPIADTATASLQT